VSKFAKLSEVGSEFLEDIETERHNLKLELKIYKCICLTELYQFTYPTNEFKFPEIFLRVAILISTVKKRETVRWYGSAATKTVQKWKRNSKAMEM